MKDYQKWLNDYKVSTEFSNISGFEILEMLQLRSNLAKIEEQLSFDERVELESADAIFLQNIDGFFASISKIIDLHEYRTSKKVLPSHWWWFLDKLVRRKESFAASA